MVKRKKPSLVTKAVKYLWLSILVDLFATLALFPSFVFLIIIPTFFTYMIDQGKNWARYLFGALFLIGVLQVMLGGLLTDDLFGIISITTIALRGYGLALLFQHKSNLWFAHRTLAKLKRQSR